MSVSAWGDILFGAAAYIGFVHPDARHAALFAVLSVVAASIIVGFGVLTQSLTFFIGGADGVGSQLTNALISFSVYPTSIFEGVPKLLLFTVLPAAFVAYVPVELLHRPDHTMMARMVGYAALLCTVAWAVFQLGLKRYESGNLIAMRS